MKTWVILLVAIVSEVVATSALKASDGFTKLVPSVLVVAGYGLAFYLLSLTLKVMPVRLKKASASLDFLERRVGSSCENHFSYSA